MAESITTNDPSTSKSSTPKKYDFTGKVALITGSNSGIGRAIAEQFAQYGADIVLTGRDQKTLQEVFEKISQETGKKPLKICGNLLEENFPEKLIQETIQKFGRLDILVNNAGWTFPEDSLDNENLLEEFDKIFKLNVRVPLKLIQLSKNFLETTEGNILNISSNASFEPILFTYSITKAALDMLTKSVAQELGSKGIRVNSINPGPTITGMGRALGEDREHFEKQKEEFKKFTILNRIPYPEEMASLASFLVSDDAKNITGALIVSDGGFLIKKRRYFSKSS